jgi:hypothetical protein
VADLSRQELQRLARLGAQARLEELRLEEAAIRRAFPDLFRGRRRGGGQTASDNSVAPPKRRRRRRSRMSPAARKAVSERMKKYWAEQRRKNA